ncbi:fimbria/pilus outer membrane usher protein, partial [Salmonella enterica subsp. enterica serovar Enteritidis]|nr:fimbria/pilus outer membrane usher protein [Salmonella enterica subsp. enterica serovar Enteritidis]
WDDGINAFLLNYRANYLHSKVGGEDSYFGQIQPGFNFGPWRLRNLSSWQNLSSEKKFESAYIYAERGLKKIKSKLTVGDKYTSADLFDSVPFRGFSLNKDESMIPFSQRTYYPTIRGIAKTNATVEVRQNGYLIYSTSVPPGQFEIGREQIADLGVGVGVLDVSIYEKNGQVQN